MVDSWQFTLANVPSILCTTLSNNLRIQNSPARIIFLNMYSVHAAEVLCQVNYVHVINTLYTNAVYGVNSYYIMHSRVHNIVCISICTYNRYVAIVFSINSLRFISVLMKTE